MNKVNRTFLFLLVLATLILTFSQQLNGAEGLSDGIQYAGEEESVMEIIDLGEDDFYSYLQTSRNRKEGVRIAEKMETPPPVAPIPKGNTEPVFRQNRTVLRSILCIYQI